MLVDCTTLDLRVRFKPYAEHRTNLKKTQNNEMIPSKLPTNTSVVILASTLEKSNSADFFCQCNPDAHRNQEGP